MKKFLLILASYAEYKLLFLFFFSNYWPSLSNILAVSQVPEDRHCLKRNTYTSLDLNSVILNEIWQAKTAKEEVNLVKNWEPKSTRYKNKWTFGIFEQRQKHRFIKIPVVEVSGLFKDYDFHLVQSIDTSLFVHVGVF